jgi:GGDEF domain-containing protein
MAGKPEEKYDPGELKRIKKNLGKLSEDEAKRMSGILGGEIGIEKTEHNINSRYQELSNQNKNKRNNIWIDQKSTSSIESVEKTPIKSIKYTYFEKIKLYYLASHPAHSIKTTKQTIRAIFDILSKQKNYINPCLLESSNYYFYKSIKTMVQSTRLISRSVKKKYIKRVENPFYWLIIDIICSWDIEGIQEEIFILKQKSHHVSIESSEKLVKLIYTPLIKLSKINRKKDIEGAMNYLYKLSVEGLFKKDLQIDRLRKSYTLAASEIDNVFVVIKLRLYPLLLMFVSSVVYDYNTMIRLKRHEILNFLNLGHEDLVTFFNKEIPKDLIKESVEDKSQVSEKSESKEIVNISVHQGNIFLDKMFPKAGWNQLSENPDMYPYFESILNIPKELSLISQNDPLQKVIILISILKDLFYGFGNFEYGFILNDLDKPVELKYQMELLIENWYLFMDDLILKQYIGPLTEYCRNMERSTDISETEYTKKIASDILWLRKTSIFPNLPLKLPKIMQPMTKTISPKLYDSVTKIKLILERMVLEIFSRGEIAIESILNPEDDSWFEIENHISKRLKSILLEDNKKLTNKLLILFSYEIIEVLNNILQSTKQVSGNNEISGLYRSEKSKGFKPIYSINSEDTYFMIKDKKIRRELNANDEISCQDYITGFLGNDQLFAYLQKLIFDNEDSELPFCIIYINIMGYKSDSNKNSSVKLLNLLQNTERSISNSIRILKDIPFRKEKDEIYILLPEIDIKHALKIARRLSSDKYSNNKLFIGLTQFVPGMDELELFSVLDNTISKQLPAPGITYYNPESKKYIKD